MVGVTGLHRKTELLGFGTSLNSSVATSAEYTPFIYLFFNCKKRLILRSQFSASRQFGTFSLWRKFRWASTPHRVRQALHSSTFHNRVKLWEIIQDLSIKCFHMEKRIRSNELDKDATSFDVLPPIWGNHRGPMPSTPLIGPSSFGRQSRSEDQFPCEHPGFSRQHGNVTSRLRLPHMFTPPSTTMFPYNNHQLAQSSPNSRRSWTAYATTRKRRLDGLMVKHLRVFAQLFAVILPILLQKDNPSFWMVTYQEKSI